MGFKSLPGNRRFPKSAAYGVVGGNGIIGGGTGGGDDGFIMVSVGELGGVKGVGGTKLAGKLVVGNGIFRVSSGSSGTGGMPLKPGLSGATGAAGILGG
jgi:hypothetical protein